MFFGQCKKEKVVLKYLRIIKKLIRA